MDDKKMKATVEWMSQKYNEMNQALFGGALGSCDFGIFTTGRGSQGGVLGWFCINGNNIYRDSRAGWLYQKNGARRTQINRSNFVSLCKPMIKLNGNYTATEKSLLTTLVHEMCHYYNYMDGYSPGRAHGKEFMAIAARVSAKSNGIFTVGKVASAEQFEGYELNDEMKKKQEARDKSKKSNLKALFVFLKPPNGNILQLTTTTSIDVINGSIRWLKNLRTPSMKEKYDGSDIYTSDDPAVIEALMSHGYKTSIRSVYRYYTVDKSKNPWINDLFNYDMKQVNESQKAYIGRIIREELENIINDDDLIPIEPGINLGIITP